MTKPASEIIREIKERYDKDKTGWSILGGKTTKGHYDTFISQPPRLWQIKSDPVNPFQAIGLGTEIRHLDEDIQKTVMKRGKPLNFQAMFPQPKNKSAIFVKGVERYSSAAINQLKTHFDSAQNKVESNLTRELNELVYKKYPSRKTMYL